MQSGTLTVTGKGETHIPLSGRPREVVVCFKEEHHHHHVPCNPHHHDKLHFEVEFEDEGGHEHHKINHHHHDRKFFLEIEWKVEGVREIFWLVFY